MVNFFHIFDLEFRDIRTPDRVHDLQRINLLILVKFRNEIRVRMKAFT